MKKSELYARYYLYNEKIEEISEGEFFPELAKSMENDYKNCFQFEDASTSCHEVRNDGWTYYMFASSYTVGWQGDRDSDAFFCKVKSVTKAERDEIVKILGAQY